eukprot:m.239972 g.239972  ORF g.239972 m.239972 type:complete len:117 (+) comp54392_c0_seq5:414-764(+)
MASIRCGVFLSALCVPFSVVCFIQRHVVHSAPCGSFSVVCSILILSVCLSVCQLSVHWSRFRLGLSVCLLRLFFPFSSCSDRPVSTALMFAFVMFVCLSQSSCEFVNSCSLLVVIR